MTPDDSAKHWQEGARDSLRAAELLLADDRNALALFHCHLAIEKALKARYIEREKEAAPYSHNLLDLASASGLLLPAERMVFLKELSRFAVEARYGDPV